MKISSSVFAALTLLSALPSYAQDSTTAPEPTTTELAPVVVTSELERSGLPLGFKPGSFVQKTREDVAAPISRSLRDVASDVPGVSFLGGPRTRAQLPQIRGLGSDRVLVLEDGARQNFQSGHSGRIFSDAGSFEEIEIVKGPLSSMFGSGALGGVINMRRPTSQDLARRSGRSRGGEITVDSATADSSFGQRYTLFGVFGSPSGSNEGSPRSIDPIVSYSSSDAENLALGNGSKLAYSASKTSELYAGLGAQLGTFKTNLKVTNYEDSGRAPLNAAEETSVASSIADTKNLKTDAVLMLNQSWANSSLELKPFVRKTRVERVRITDSRRDLLLVESVGLDAHFDFQTSLAVRGRTVVGFEGFRDSNRGERAGATYGLFPNGETTQSGLYVQQPFDLTEDVSLIVGARADQYKSTPSNAALRGNEGSAVSPKLYVTWQIEKSEFQENGFFFGWGRGFNAPRLQDLYVSGLHFPGQPPAFPNNFFQANPDLKPETADSFETGLRGRTSTWTYSLTGFLTLANDFIMRDVNVAAGTTQLNNIDRATLYGAELGVKNTIGKWIVGLTSSAVRGINRRADEPIADTPADRFRLSADFAFADSLIVGGETEVVLGQQRVPNGVTATGGYTIFNALANWNVDKDWAFGAKLGNVLNRAYRRHGSQIDEAGLDVRVSLTARF